MFNKLDFITEKYDELAQTVSDPAVIANQPVWQKYVKEMGEMEPIVKKYKEYRDAKAGIADAKEMLEDGDEEMRELAKMEISELEEKLPQMEEELKGLKTLEGKPYRLLKLPLPRPIFDDGDRLPATYANFLIINKAVLYPTYNQPDNDEKAKEVLQQAFPEYEIVGIDCTPLIKQHGSLHCCTMQFPKGVLKQ